MTPGLEWLLIAWGIVTVLLIILLIYRSTLTMKEDDQLFLDESSTAMATEQRELSPRWTRSILWSRFWEPLRD
jgi:Tfp pilus assembly protein PilN